ncbi:hypothetical protein HPB47_013961 [Ixodes persulcatus]|uniref:Uncharacterized protein n=1 Tax=Ixodes persulcatus TaxID=34615 RepID=A0AC60QXH8_IXOPE|nr:hypothetical protein HPB47_013961 [Ixodes persulcatus]
MNHAYLLFLRPFLTEVQVVNKAYETSTKIVLPTCRLDPLTCDLDSYADPKPHLGYEAEKKIRDMKGQGITSEAEDSFRERCAKVHRHLFKELKLRLPDNINIMRQTSLIPLMELLGVPAEIITVIDFQWGKITLVPWENTSDVVSFWSEVVVDYGLHGAKLLWPYCAKLNILQGNGEVERVFSQVNIVKSKLRNKMTTFMANALLTLRAVLKRHNKRHNKSQME